MDGYAPSWGAYMSQVITCDKLFGDRLRGVDSVG